MNTQQATRLVLTATSISAFIATIPLANWWLNRFGFWELPLLGPVASGVIFAGFAFVLRDIAQLLVGRWWTLLPITAGTALSYLLADPYIATASAAAFGLSETLDWAVYTRLANHRFKLAVLISSIIGSAADSALFLWIAFDTTNGWWQLAAVKSLVVLLALPIAGKVRRDLSLRVHPEIL